MAAALSLAAFASADLQGAADLPVRPKTAADAVLSGIDDRVTFSWMPKGTDPGVFSVRPDGASTGKTAKQVYSFTHFDAWAYGTNFFTISMFKSDHTILPIPARTRALLLIPGRVATAPTARARPKSMVCSARLRFNELFNTKSFSYGPLHNVSFEVGMDANTENNYLSPAKRDVVAVCNSRSTCLTRVTSTSRR